MMVKGEARISYDPGRPPPDIYFQKLIFKKRFTCVYSEMCKNEDKIPQPEMGQVLKTTGRTYSLFLILEAALPFTLSVPFFEAED